MKKAGFTFTEVLNLDQADFDEWETVCEILELQEKMDLIEIMYAKNPTQLMENFRNKFLILSGNNPFIPKPDEIKRTRERLEKLGI